MITTKSIAPTTREGNIAFPSHQEDSVLEYNQCKLNAKFSLDQTDQ